MVTVVIPFVGSGGKTRLHESAEVRDALALAMFEDVLAACTPVGDVRIADQPDGQGEAVAAALAGVDGPLVVVNADLPCAVPDDVRLLAETAPALVAAADGTTNALSLPSAGYFEPLYGPGSAERFQSRCGAVSMVIPNLADDVDTVEDLIRLQLRVGPRTLAALSSLDRRVA